MDITQISIKCTFDFEKRDVCIRQMSLSLFLSKCFNQ
nr:MAG TPA: hypothetical protein [Caudoviricetes sp.]